MNIGIPIQNGNVTHIHDQSIYPVNLSTTKATPNKPAIPTPDEVLLLLLLLLISLTFNNYFTLPYRRFLL